jgi:chromosome segregation ATPase
MSSQKRITSTAYIPDEPPHTCPIIDEVIEILEERFGGKDGSIDLMEKIRTNCSDIRSWGESWKEYAEYCEEEKDDFEKRYEQSEEENSDKTDEIIQLQKKIDELESKISDLEYDLRHTTERT